MKKTTEERYQRHVSMPEVGVEGQQKLFRGAVLIVGCGALGSTQASLLARAGVGRLRLVDHDIVELGNLPRSGLFDEKDAAAGLLKTEVAAGKLRLLNSTVEIESVTAAVTPRNIEALLDGMALVLDGTDNFEARYLVNDACVKHGVPWIFGGVIGTLGMTMNILPGRGPCLRCVFPKPPDPAVLPTPGTRGVLNTLPALIASMQATEACKILLGREPALGREMVYIDLWGNTCRRVEVERADRCPACAERRFEFLEPGETR
jgi:molybdopterin/thiamine biosynthesis adenylyltransferase